jgi:uncharacterized protein (DUF488 family)
LGHSTRDLESFLDILKHYRIEFVIDVRRWPTSKKYPWFSKEKLHVSLNDCDIEYLHYPELGGFRKEGYGTFARSDEFKDALNRLIEVIGNRKATLLCAELLWFRCHRRYIAKKLVERGHQIIHVFDKEKIQKHNPSVKEIEERMKLVIWCDKKAKRARSTFL